MRKFAIAPSILSADFARLGEEVRAITDAGADYVHVDVMDGHFVPNLTIGPCVVKALTPHTHLPLDVHLMIANPGAYLDDFMDAGANVLTLHYEATPHSHRSLAHIRSRGVKAGISVVPSTPPEALHYLLGSVDLILVMSVNPGFGGQSFIPEQLEKIRVLRRMIDESAHDVLLEVDGGVNPDTVRAVREAGADVVVAGSAVFTGGSMSYARNITALRA
ncbi:MAG: ribulose-phosphate 3-epimerase [Sphaerospermopsis sp. SIO1G2]|nr:ribulose-phosphate 3-epimerase [Sphaerospermopsis sp. SIO1G2]